MDDEGNIIVADSRNDRIQVVKIKALKKNSIVFDRCSLQVEYFSANLEQKALDLVNLTGLVG